MHKTGRDANFIEGPAMGQLVRMAKLMPLVMVPIVCLAALATFELARASGEWAQQAATATNQQTARAQAAPVATVNLKESEEMQAIGSHKQRKLARRRADQLSMPTTTSNQTTGKLI